MLNTVAKIKKTVKNIAETSCFLLGVYHCSLTKKELGIYIKDASDEEATSVYNEISDLLKNNPLVDRIFLVTKDKQYFVL